MMMELINPVFNVELNVNNVQVRVQVVLIAIILSIDLSAVHLAIV